MNDQPHCPPAYRPICRIDVSPRPDLQDARGAEIKQQIAALGIDGITSVTVSSLYFIEHDLEAQALTTIVESMLCDPVAETATFGGPTQAPARPADAWSVEVVLKPGVTDSVAESLLTGVELIGWSGVARAATGLRYVLSGRSGALDDPRVHRIARGLLANEVIQTFAVNRPVAPPFTAPAEPDETALTIPIRAADASRLAAISAERRLSLDPTEMAAIRDRYKAMDRDPTDVELETLAQTWSEHCVHKTFRAHIEYVEGESPPVHIDSMLATYIQAATERVARPWVHSAFVDNAGIIAFDDHLDLAFKVETHNHPSALEPFGGANTGVGGVVRDVLGVSARPIANTDVLCFGPDDLPLEDLPDGVLHPRRVADGVIAGIEDYGNKMGIPTVNGAIVYDPDYTANPLVYCGCLGVLPRGAHPRRPQPDDLVVMLGGSTGRDGLRGATFSSMEMDHETGDIAGSAVQIGHPIHEKDVTEAVIQARDEKLYTAITDCGAGGLSSAIGEMAAELGATVDLRRVPLKYPGLRPWEIWLSEAQERMVMAVPSLHWPRLQGICQRLGVEATVLGHLTGDGQLTVRVGKTVVGQFDVEFLHHGRPDRRMQARWTPPQTQEPRAPMGATIQSDLLALLASPDIRSREPVVRRYDHEVQGGTVVKPLVGNEGHGDAAVIVPLDAWRTQTEGPVRGVSLSVGIHPRLGRIDPYLMAWAAVDEAARNAIAVGANPDHMALLDNFCWGNPNLPDRLGGLVRCARGCHDAAVAYGMPFVSGKDSLNNEFTGADGRKQAIPGTILISAVGIVPDARQAATSDLKAAGDIIYVVGETHDELGGSAWYALHGHLGANAPQPQPHGIDTLRALHRAIADGLVTACHDCADGGLAVTLAEMAIGGQLGLDADLHAMPRLTRKDNADNADNPLENPARLAFSESLTRFAVTVRPNDTTDFEARLSATPVAAIGRVEAGGRFQLRAGSQIVVDTHLEDLERAWRVRT